MTRGCAWHGRAMGEWKGMLGSKSGNKGKVEGEGAPWHGMAPDLSRSDYDLNQALAHARLPLIITKIIIIIFSSPGASCILSPSFSLGSCACLCASRLHTDSLLHRTRGPDLRVRRPRASAISQTIGLSTISSSPPHII